VIVKLLFLRILTLFLWCTTIGLSIKGILFNHNSLISKLDLHVAKYFFIMYIFLFFIIIGFLVLTSTIVMTIWFKTNRILNFYLICTTIILCLYLIVHGLNNCKLIEEWKCIWNINYFQVVLLLTPSAYLFFEKLISNYKYPEIKDLCYFVIPVIFFYYLDSINFKHFLFEKGLVFILFLLYTLFFCLKSYYILKKNVWNVGHHYDTLNPIVKNWADFIFKMILLVLCHFFIFFISQFFNLSKTFNLYLESSVLIVFLIGYFKVIFSPMLFYGSPQLERITNSTTVSTSYINKVWILEFNNRPKNPRDVQVSIRIQNNVSMYIEQIENIALVNYSFRKVDYSISGLSAELGLPKYYLEFIFKYHCKVTFNDYKKIVRIYDAVNLIDNGYLSSNTLDTLSRYVGFASYNPFLLNFKEIIGVSPFDYNKKRTITRNK